MSSAESLVQCPRCGREVRLPTDIGGEDQLRCPFCQGEFLGRELPGFTPPALEVIRRGAAGASATGVGGPSRRGTEERGTGGDAVESFAALSTRSTSADSSSGDGSIDDVGTAPIERRRYYSRSKLAKGRPASAPRRRGRHQAHAWSTAEILKIALGAACAFPVAQLILWWAFGQDPLRLAPRVSRVLPYAVPSSLRGESLLPQWQMESDEEPTGRSSIRSHTFVVSPQTTEEILPPPVEGDDSPAPAAEEAKPPQEAPPAESPGGQGAGRGGVATGERGGA